MKKKLIIIFNILFICFKFFALPQEDLYNLLLENNHQFWIPDNCINILKSNNNQKIKEYYPNIESLNYYSDAEDKTFYWYELQCFSNFCIISEYDFMNDAICISEGGTLSFYFNFIQYINNHFYLKIKKTYTCKKLENTNPFSKWPIEEDECEMILKFDGDYLYVYLNDLKTLYGTFCRINNATLDEYNKLIKTGKCDLSKVTWPRHADGTCDYDDSSKSSKTAVSTSSTTIAPSTNVTVNKNMLVTENLKLRSGEATTTQVLTVMSAGTKVKILELGKAETIDGINSNWVKVEVQSGAKDRNGKKIKAGTVGWCYGGYLK